MVEPVVDGVPDRVGPRGSGCDAVIMVAVWMPVAVLLLTPLWSTCPERNARAAAMLDRIVAAIPGSRDARTDTPARRRSRARRPIATPPQR
jgi:hypothetical protein